MRLVTVLENCIFHISPMYEFSHSQGHLLPKGSCLRLVCCSFDSGCLSPPITVVYRRGTCSPIVPTPDSCAATPDVHGSQCCSGRDVRFIARPPAQIRTCGFPAYGLYGAFAVKVTSRRSRRFCRAGCFILLFDPRREHSSVPTVYYHRRRAQRRSRTALLERRRRLVLDHREHGGRLPVIGWFGTRDPREACHWPRAIAARTTLRLNP
jgi:hypothetical protein